MTAASPLPSDQLVQMFRSALLIRRVEEQVAAMIGAEFHGATHFCMGQELTAVAACASLNSDDWMFTTHRNRAHLLARGADPARVFAELLGRSDGYSHGKAGSFHVSAPDLNVPTTSAMVGGGQPLAVGAALGCKLEGKGRVTLAFFGDGAINEGAFHECVNLASLWKVPLALVCENNDAVPYDLARSGLAVRDIADYVSSYGLPSRSVDGAELESVYVAVAEAVAWARAGSGPAFVEVRTHKAPLNQLMAPSLPCGRFEVSEAWQPSTDHPMPEWRSIDPLLKLVKLMLERKAVSREQLGVLEREIAGVVDQATAFARSSPFPPLEAARQEVYA